MKIINKEIEKKDGKNEIKESFVNPFENFKNQSLNTETIIKTIDIDINKAKFKVIDIAKKEIPEFEIDDNNKEIINQLFNYFIGNKEYCELNNISLNKGILLCGGVGTGKSKLFKIFKIFTAEILRKNYFRMFTSSELTDNVNINGVKVLENLNHNFYENKPNPINCYIDDICSKNEKIKHYGSEISVIEQVINMRYNIFDTYKKLSHFSTNIVPKNLIDFYDIRIIDRLNEMCNIFELNGLSRRK